jgi:CubicO group peptidase (beta-lactamase class C family)
MNRRYSPWVRWLRNSVVAVGLGRLLLSTVAAGDSTNQAPTTIDDLTTTIQGLLQKHKIPGCAISLVSRTNNIWIAGLGWADVAARRPATADTLFRIGSTSKAFAALSVLKLQEEGRISLDDSVKDRAPELQFQNAWEKHTPVRLVHLLEHTTGFDDLHLKDYAHNDPRPASLAEGLAFCASSRISRWEPGTRMSYCNAGPPMAAYVVQKITGVSFEEYVRRTFFEPIGMRDATYFFPTNSADRLATLYAADGMTPEPYWHILVRPSGSINATARDMAAYLHFYLNRGSLTGPAILARTFLDRMEQPASGPSARLGIQTGYGLGNYTTQRDGLLWHGHNGGVNGGLTELAYNLDYGVGYALMVNSESGAGFEAIAKTLSAFLIRDLPKPVLPTPAAVSLQLAPERTGYYRLASPRNQMTYFIEGLLGVVHVAIGPTNLIFKPLLGPAKNLVAASPTTFRPADAPQATATFGQDPEGLALYIGSDTLLQIAAWRVWLPLLVLGGWLVFSVLALPYAFIWAIGWWRGRLPNQASRWLRVLPLLAILSLAGAVALLVFSGSNTTHLFTRFGAPTAWSIGLSILTVLFAAASLGGLGVAFRARRSEPRRLAWMFALILCSLHSVVAAYLAIHGVIGWRIWL